MCVSMCIHSYIYIYVYSCVYVCVCEYIHACKHMCIYLHIFRFTPLTYEGIDILCQPWPPYFWSTIHILENKCSSIKRNQKDKKSWWSQYSVPKNNQLHTRKLQICGNLPVWLLQARKRYRCKSKSMYNIRSTPLRLKWVLSNTLKCKK